MAGVLHPVILGTGVPVLRESPLPSGPGTPGAAWSLALGELGLWAPQSGPHPGRPKRGMSRVYLGRPWSGGWPLWPPLSLRAPHAAAPMPAVSVGSGASPAPFLPAPLPISVLPAPQFGRLVTFRLLSSWSSQCARVLWKAPAFPVRKLPYVMNGCCISPWGACGKVGSCSARISDPPEFDLFCLHLFHRAENFNKLEPLKTQDPGLQPQKSWPQGLWGPPGTQRLSPRGGVGVCSAPSGSDIRTPLTCTC